MNISDRLDQTYSNIEAAIKELQLRTFHGSAHRNDHNQRAESLLTNALSLLDEIQEAPWPLASWDYVQGEDE